MMIVKALVATLCRFTAMANKFAVIMLVIIAL